MSAWSPRARLTFVSCALFVVAAWPLLLVDVPPLQDLPNHLATTTVLEHPEKWLELRSNGLLKTNSALAAWLLATEPTLGPGAAARIFVAVVIAANAWVLPRFVCRFAGPRAAETAGLLAWPLLHNWFVSMGMLNFALALPMALGVLLLLHARRPASAAGLALCAWYAHPFPVMIVAVLVAFDLLLRGLSSGDMLRAAQTELFPLAPALAASVAAAVKQGQEGSGLITAGVAHHSTPATLELLYDAWTEWTYGFTWHSAASLAPTALLIWFSLRSRRKTAYFTAAAMALLAAAYFLTPPIVANWFYVNARFLPFLTYGALLQVPDELPPWIARALAGGALTYSVGLGVDYVTLAADNAEVAAGARVVPEGARLLPLMFRGKLHAENTRSLLHAWGFYVVEKHTAAPLLFAHSQSFPVMYREAPPPRFNHLILENFAPSMRDPEWICRVLREEGIVLDDCAAAWRARWADFWADATPRFDHVLMWDAPEGARALVPPVYRVVYERGHLVIYARQPSPAASDVP